MLKKLIPGLVLVSPFLLGSDNWPQWRGPGGHGISQEKGFPLHWSDIRNVAWKARIPGRGHSSPVVWGDRIFLTTAIRMEKVASAQPVTHYRKGEVYRHPQSEGAEYRHQLKLLCLDRRTGRLIWARTAFEGTPYDHRHRANTYASGTPVTDGRYVYALFDAEGLYCYDFEGNLVWKKSLGKIAKAGMGYGMSPVLFEDLLIIQMDKQGFGITVDPDSPPAEGEFGDDSFITGLDKATGKEVWRTARNHRRSWATPLLVFGDDRVELVTSGAESVISYNPSTGEEYWRAEGVVSHPIPSPVAGKGLVFLSAGSQRKKAMAIRLGGSGDLTGTPFVAWTYEKGTAYVPSPILYGDYLYLLTDRGVVTCLKAATGEVIYTDRLPAASTFKSSPVAFEGKILFSSEDGQTTVVEAGPEFKILNTNSLGESIWASPALAGGQVFIRTEGHLYCIRKTGQAAGGDP